jgi:hypothetical protein
MRILNENIMRDEIKIPPHINEEFRDILNKLDLGVEIF